MKVKLWARFGRLWRLRVARYLALVLVLSLSGCAAGPQRLTATQRAITSASWSAEEIAPGVVWKYCHFNNLFEAKQSINVLDVDLDAENVRVRFAYLETGRQKTSELVRQTKAVAAVNGTFFDMKAGGSTCFLRVDNQIITRTAPLEKRDDGAIAINASENVAILQRPSTGWESADGQVHLMSSGPLLVQNGEIYEQRGKTKFYRKRHPRTAVGITLDNRLVLVTVDGRSHCAAGMSCAELTRTMRALGCYTAVNLDGGGSVTMWVRGKAHGGVVNYPCDNQKFDHRGEREVSNAVIIMASDADSD